MRLKIKGVTHSHPQLQIGETLLVDATTDELYVSFPMEPSSSKQKVFARGRKLLLEGGFKPKKFRFVDDIHFKKKVINGVRVDAVTVKITYKGNWNDVRINT